MVPQEIIVPPQTSPLRLDKFLVDRFPKTSRAFWRKNLEEKVRVEGKRPKKGVLLNGGERVSILIRDDSGDSFMPDSSLAVKVIAEDPDYLLVEKPPGVPVHPLTKEEKGTLVQGLLGRYPEIASIGNSPREMGLVHRLDNETSGLVLVARSPEAYRFLREEFRRRRVEKEYFAWVEGKMKKMKDWEKIETPIAHHPKNKRKMVVTVGAGFKPARNSIKGREAITFYKVEKQTAAHSLLHVRIPTGVRHQIRVHLSDLGHPVVGDPLYGEPGDRLFLHASRIVFRHPKSLKKVEYESKLPEDMREPIRISDSIFPKNRS